MSIASFLPFHDTWLHQTQQTLSPLLCQLLHKKCAPNYAAHWLYIQETSFSSFSTHIKSSLGVMKCALLRRNVAKNRNNCASQTTAKLTFSFCWNSLFSITEFCAYANVVPWFAVKFCFAMCPSRICFNSKDMHKSLLWTEIIAAKQMWTRQKALWKQVASIKRLKECQWNQGDVFPFGASWNKGNLIYQRSLGVIGGITETPIASLSSHAMIAIRANCMYQKMSHRGKKGDLDGRLYPRKTCRCVLVVNQHSILSLVSLTIWQQKQHCIWQTKKNKTTLGTIILRTHIALYWSCDEGSWSNTDNECKKIVHLEKRRYLREKIIIMDERWAKVDDDCARAIQHV